MEFYRRLLNALLVHFLPGLLPQPSHEDAIEPEDAQELASAIESEDFKTIESFISNGGRVNGLMPWRKTELTPLMLACELNKINIVAKLLNENVNVNKQNRDKLSALKIASEHGHLELVILLINAQADVNLHDLHGWSPLHSACRSGRLEVVNSLIRAQADINLQTENGSSSLCIASKAGHHDVTIALIKAQADVNAQEFSGRSPLNMASQNGHDDVAKALIKVHADVNLQNVDGWAPLHCAAENGHHQLVRILIEAGADVNLMSNCNETPLYFASDNGHRQTVDLLIEALADISLKNENGLSPLYIAVHNGHNDVVRSLIRACDAQNNRNCIDEAQKIAAYYENGKVMRNLEPAHHPPSGSLSVVDLPPSDAELSQQLYSALVSSGFIDSRAALQSAAADVLLDIIKKRSRNFEFFIVGSFSEGWGNSLATLDGTTDPNSDIDLVEMFPGDPIHVKDVCECKSNVDAYQTLVNGHITSSGYASKPAKTFPGCYPKPTVDRVSANRLCCYPPIAPLQKERSEISPCVLQSLEQDLFSPAPPCHVVRAAPPGKAGEQLRVSTSFLERRLLRSLNTVQGQVFIILKWLLKTALCNEGFKSYHAKTIAFRMLEKTPAQEWTPENLVCLTRRSLETLLECVMSERSEDARIMKHFFLNDTAVYLRGVNHKSAEEVNQALNQAVKALKDVVARLPHWLLQFKSSLRPITDSGRFYFHPFLILPTLLKNAIRNVEKCEYHEIYDVVMESVDRLSDKDCISPESRDHLLRLIEKLPDCARLARESLKALTYLKFSDRTTAAEIVRSCSVSNESRGIDWPAEKSAIEATTEFVWQQLTTQDSAWKFCFFIERRPKLPFNVDQVANYIPLKQKRYTDRYYMNFEAVLRALHFELNLEGDTNAQKWIQNVAYREDADEQELAVAAASCTDLQLLRQLCRRFVAMNGFWPAWLGKKVDQLSFAADGIAGEKPGPAL